MFSPDQEQAVEMQLLNVEVDEWEIAVDRLILQEVIGRGAFGAVWRAHLSEPGGKPGNRTVAAKCFTRKIMYRCTLGVARQTEICVILFYVVHINSISFCVAVRQSMTVYSIITQTMIPLFLLIVIDHMAVNVLPGMRSLV